jgi:hypothetical protein
MLDGNATGLSKEDSHTTIQDRTMDVCEALCKDLIVNIYIYP